ncbi:hypothetical protein [Sutcliffiella rhizosphaerae]|uniref:Transposase n=1 Tax=Sutcliffiella rhizosphaerae TaxID=2880967 RepID=A0ABM8YL45_9BACI|nr:hypothetical protein [Sutcliffiella rhizosphaerae]CAG9620477.1 hypothetical protein BACCIP111883_01245 [Sutcliffiella rhizosphaerae]
MGYMLPVQMDTYNQYANRTVLEKQRIKLEPVRQSTFYKIDSHLAWQEVHQNIKHTSFTNKKNKSTNSINEKLMATITGKGLFINEFI